MRKYSFISIVLMSAATSSVAAPVVDRVVQSEDGYLEIFGSGFGEKAHAAPLYWNSFDGDESVHLSRIPTLDNELNGSVIELEKGNRVLSFDLSNGKAGGPQNIVLEAPRMYLSVKRLYQFSLDDQSILSSAGGLNLKKNRLWAGFKSPENNNIYLGYQGNEGIHSGRIVSEFTGHKTNWLGESAPQLGFQWLNEEIIYQSSGVDQINGVFSYILNGMDAKSQDDIHRTKERSSLYKYVYLDQVSNYKSDRPIVVLYDDLYIDDALNRVVVTDSEQHKQYDSADVQIPQIWRDDYIKIFPRKLKGKEVYLYVYDSDGKTHRKGFRVCPDCPKPPLIQ